MSGSRTRIHRAVQLQLTPTGAPRRSDIVARLAFKLAADGDVSVATIRNDQRPAVELDADLLAWADRVAASVAAKLPACFELDDLKQVARIAAWKNLPKYKGDHKSGAPVQGFLFPYVKNACLMSVRRRNWIESTAPRIKPSTATGEDTEQAADTSLRSKLVRWLIRERLTEQQQYCLMQHQAGVTTDKIAARARIPRKAVIESIESAYGQLRTDLREIGL